jgi:hypothetical protein
MQTHRQQDNIISLPLFFQTKEGGLKATGNAEEESRRREANLLQ